MEHLVGCIFEGTQGRLEFISLAKDRVRVQCIEGDEGVVRQSEDDFIKPSLTSIHLLPCLRQIYQEQSLTTR